MAEERITTVHAPDGDTTSHTTIVREGGGGAGWLVAIVLVLALVAGIYLFARTNGSETAKNNAVAEAAHEVGQAANKVGNAAQEAADAAKR